MTPFTLIGLGSDVVVLDKPGGTVQHTGKLVETTMGNIDLVEYKFIYHVAINRQIFMFNPDRVQPKPGEVYSLLTVTETFAIAPSAETSS